MKELNIEVISIKEVKLPYQDKTIKVYANFGSLEEKNNFRNCFKSLNLDTKIVLFVDEQKELPLKFREEYKGQQIVVSFFEEEKFCFSTDFRSKYFLVDLNLSWLEIIEDFSKNYLGPDIQAGESYKRNK